MITEKPQQRSLSNIKHCGNGEMVDTKDFKKKFLQGDGDGDAMYYCDKRLNYPSMY
jgi:hypothetical protein